MPRKQLPDHLRRPPGRPPVHTWDLWLNGESHSLVPGIDFQCSTDSLRTQLYQQGRARGVKVTVKKAHNQVLVRADGPKTAGRAQKYDWDKLLDGEVHQLNPGVDFKSKSTSFQAYARHVAAERGVGLSIKTMGDTLFVQAKLPAPKVELPFDTEGF